MLFIWQLWYFGPRLLNLEEWQGIRAHFALSQVMSFGYFGRSRKKQQAKLIWISFKAGLYAITSTGVYWNKNSSENQ